MQKPLTTVHRVLGGAAVCIGGLLLIKLVMRVMGLQSVVLDKVLLAAVPGCLLLVLGYQLLLDVKDRLFLMTAGSGWNKQSLEAAVSGCWLAIAKAMQEGKVSALVPFCHAQERDVWHRWLLERQQRGEIIRFSLGGKPAITMSSFSASPDHFVATIIQDGAFYAEHDSKVVWRGDRPKRRQDQSLLAADSPRQLHCILWFERCATGWQLKSFAPRSPSTDFPRLPFSAITP